ncbi:type I 3-dehydroquinate dehydratase [Propionibacterium australiense]|uniref:3-dehydroquinate dehydratase n=1 Tax=Propionibacterium australiense TaxID=119981 RepID=A0A383S2N9_9ACTN|nr:type I 3-dehydroquinate dehydratase [Propionibacterium australiense]SYZ32240.1 3-dehydroquinate dehydratase [Propionibacterium australiense]VEH90605.1 3-dehydroquinate dehydratase [Propionibacterium australiense]
MTVQTVRVGNVVLGEGRPKVIVPITGATADEILAAASTAISHEIDILEWRIDFFEGALDSGAVTSLAGQLAARLNGRPVLATFRTADEGGEKRIGVQDYVDLNLALIASGQVNAVDVEFFRGSDAVHTIIAAAHAQEMAVIASNHDFDATPPVGEIVSRLRAMQDMGADVAKLACTPHDVGDLLTLLSATWQMSVRYADHPIITMSMGRLGMLSRMTGAFFGSAATFGMVGRASAPGQIPVEDLNRILKLIGEWAPTGCCFRGCC